MPTPTPLDGLSAPGQTPALSKQAAPSTAMVRWKWLLIAIFGISYFAYGAWSLLLVSLLPSADPRLQNLSLLGLLIAGIVGAVFLAIGAILLQRIASSKVSSRDRFIALLKVVGAIVPALILSVVTPLMILREVPFQITITEPDPTQELVAPVAISFSVNEILPVLALSDFVPIKYRWDVNNDKVVDQETDTPELTATFEREGVFVVTVQMLNQTGLAKTATKRFIIRRSVFKVTPEQPIVNQVAVFSLTHLYAAEGAVRDVQWDFNGDGTVDVTSSSLEIDHTFFQTGNSTVTATVNLMNNTQVTLQRVVRAVEAPPLPFQVELFTEPKTLIGSTPFPVLFRIETAENVAKVEWDFGDDSTGEGSRIAHTFTQKGTFPVNVKVHTQSGVIAHLQTTVRMVDALRLSDLTFEGTPDVNGSKIEGEVPLSLNLTPRTATPFIEFQWEAPEATDVGSTETSLQAIYRREGTYTVTLIAQDLEDHVLRMPITVTVKPAASSLVIAMVPETGVAPLAVEFDASESYIPGETITGFVWNFGDGSQEQFGGARSEHTFQKEGTYSIGLTVRTTTGKTYTTRKTLIVREPSLRACITPSRIRGAAPLGVEFTSDCTVGTPTSYLWDFGDGAQSDQRSIIHVFDTPGTYNTTLTIRDGDASHSTSVLITVQ